MKIAAFSTVALLAFAGSAFGQIQPSGVTETTGLNSTIRNAPRTYMAYYAASNFGTLGGPTQLTGMQFRLFAPPTQNNAGGNPFWPPSDQSFANYKVILADPSAGLIADGEFLSLTPSFTSYMTNAVTVYDAALTITANSFANDGTTTTPASWGMTINFSTPFTLDPSKGLLMYITHSGYTGGAINPFFAAGDFANGVADAISSTAGANANNPSGFSSPMVVNFIPTPGAVALVGLGGLMAMRRRRA